MFAAAAAKKNADSQFGHFYYFKALRFEASAISKWQLAHAQLLSLPLLVTVVAAFLDQLTDIVRQLAFALLLRQSFKKG